MTTLTRPKKAVTVIRMTLTRMEVPALVKGKPSYRWTNGYYVHNPINDAWIYPPVSRKEAYALARDLAGENSCKVEIYTGNK